MGRRFVGERVVKVRMDAAMVARIDARSDNRSEFVRDVVREHLDTTEVPISAAEVKRAVADMVDPDGWLGDVPMKPAAGDAYRYEARTKLPDVMSPPELEAVGGPPAMPPEPKKNSLKVPTEKVVHSADQAALLALLSKKPLRSRDAEKAMAWMGLRYVNAERGLLGKGAIAVVDGLLVVT